MRTASLLVSVTVNRGVAEDGSPAALIGGTILIPLWLGFGLGHAPRGPGAAGKESHHPGPAPPRLALDDPFKMPPSAGFSRIAVEVELVSHDDHPDERGPAPGHGELVAGKHIATAIVTDAAPDDGPRWYPGLGRWKDVSRHRPLP